MRIIAHLDMDAFFASVEEAITPRFSEKPIVVGTEPCGGNARGVVSTANYKAREYGIHSAMPISIAWRLSEEARKQGKEEVIFLPVDMELYEKVSRNILEIVKKYSQNIEQGSIDEFYFDLSYCQTFIKAERVCKKIKKEIKDKEKITCSVGLGPNKLIAKIAAGKNKPNGLFTVDEKDIQQFLMPLNVRELPGVGPKTAEILYEKNIKIVGDLQKLSKQDLKQILGKYGEDMYSIARGIDNESIIEKREVKSMGEQITFDRNSKNALYICEEFKKLSFDVFNRFIKSEFETFSSIGITIRFSDFETKTISKSFKKSMTKKDYKKFEIEILKIVLPFLDHRKNPKSKLIRLIGVKIEKFNHYSKQNSLF